MSRVKGIRANPRQTLLSRQKGKPSGSMLSGNKETFRRDKEGFSIPK